MTPTLIETDDADVAHEVLTELYRVKRFVVDAGEAYLRVSQQEVGPVGLRRFSFSMECGVEGDPLHSLYFGHVVDGTIAYHHGGHGDTYGPGDVALAVHPDRPFSGNITRASVEYAVFDESLLAEVADTAAGRTTPAIRFTGYQPTTPEDSALWVRTLHHVTDLAASAGDRPLVAGAAARLLAATALTVFPNTAATDTTFEDRRDAHPAALRRALDFVEAHAHEDITAADIAVAAKTTIRAVQLAFRRHLDSTPTAYLRRVRLDHAHRELREADPASTTVTQIAARWGFWHPGRFAAQYQLVYGETPGATLRGR